MEPPTQKPTDNPEHNMSYEHISKFLWRSYVTSTSQTKNGSIQNFSSQTDRFDIRMTTYTANREWSSKSKPYTKNAAMPN